MHNDFRKTETCAEIFVRFQSGEGVWVKVDVDDLEKLVREGFSVSKRVVRHRFIYPIIYRDQNGRREYHYLHRWVLGNPEQMIVDHINGDPLDNRKSNLRPVTKSENMQNRVKLAANNTSGTHGVSWNKNAGKWSAYITVQRRKKHLGYFDSKENAERVAKEFRAIYFPLGPEARGQANFR